MKKSRKVVKIMYTMEALIILTVSCVQKLQKLQKLSECLPPTNMWSLSALTRKYSNTILFPLNVAWCSCFWLVSAVFWRFQQVQTNLYSYLMLHNFWRHSFNSPQCDLWLVCWSIVAMIALAYLKIILFLERKEISNVSKEVCWRQTDKSFTTKCYFSTVAIV